MITDVVSGVFSLICTALFLRFVWQPKSRFFLKAERERATAGELNQNSAGRYPYTLGQTAKAWLPWGLLIACCGLWGAPPWKKLLNELFSGVAITS